VLSLSKHSRRLADKPKAEQIPATKGDINIALQNLRDCDRFSMVILYLTPLQKGVFSTQRRKAAKIFAFFLLFLKYFSDKFAFSS